MTTPILRASPSTITVTQVPAQICGPIGLPVMLYNADITNTAYAGYSSDLGVTNGTAIPPLTYTVMDGTRALWAMCPTGSVQVNVTPGGTYQSASAAQIAEQIALSGVSFTQPEIALAALSPAIGVWGSSVINFPPGACAYELVISPTNAANPFVTDLDIIHSLSGNIMARETMTVSNWPGVDNEFVRVRGPLHGNQLTIGGQVGNSAFINGITGGAFTAGTFTVSVFAVFTPWVYDWPRATVDSLVIGAGTTNPMGSIFHSDAFAIPASTITFAGMLLSYGGNASLYYSTNTAAVTALPFIRCYTVANGQGAVLRFPPVTGLNAVGSYVNLPIILPNTWNRFDWNNTSANPGTANIDVMGVQ